MSASDEWTEWCLTPRGWERGCQREDYNRFVGERPNNTALVMVYREYLSSTFSSLDRSCIEKERIGTEEEIRALLDLYGSSPETL